MSARARWVVVALLATATGCELGLDAARLDAGSVDAASSDAGSIDAASSDASIDAASSDASIDAASSDASIDAATIDAAMLDAGIDAATTDAGPHDAGVDAQVTTALDSGTGPRDAGPSPCSGDAPRASTGLSSATRPPLGGGAPPEVGAWFQDETFGTCLARISNAGPSSYFDPPTAIGASGRILLATRGGYQYHRFDLDAPSGGSTVLGSLYSNNAPGFVAGSDDVVQFLGQDRGLYFGVHRLALSGGAGVTEGRIFEAEVLAAFPTADRLLAANRSPYSEVGTGVYEVDGGNDLLGFVTVDHATGRVLGHLPAPAGVRMVAMTPSGRVVVATWTHADVYDATFAESSRRRVPFDDYGYELDTAVLPGGHDALVWATLTELRAIDLGTPGSTSQVLLSWPRPSSSSLWVRISGAARDKPGYVVVAFGGCAACAPASHPGNGRISIVEIDGGATVYDLAWHYSERLGIGEYGAVLALPSRDLSRIVFNSTWGGAAGEDRSDLFLAQIPASAIPAADPL